MSLLSAMIRPIGSNSRRSWATRASRSKVTTRPPARSARPPTTSATSISKTVTAEKGSGRNFRWLVYDLVTGEFFRRHHDHEVTRLGFTPFQFLPMDVKKRLNQTGRDSDYDRTFWKLERDWVKYEPEPVRVEL